MQEELGNGSGITRVLERSPNGSGAERALERNGSTQAVPGRDEIAAELEWALPREQFRLVYQPVVDLNTASLVGIEAFLRWDHPEFGSVPPGVFVPIADERELIGPIGAWVLTSASAQLREWRDRYDEARELSVFVNLSPAELARPGIVETVRSAVTTAGVPMSQVVLEITERAVLPDRERTEETLWQLHDLGVRLSLDDFGTPRSSLNGLRDYPVDVVKIERTFIRELAHSARDRIIVASLLEMAQSLGVLAIAEGVETLEELQILVDLGCERGQGFYWSRPLPADDLEFWLATPPVPLFAAQRRRPARHPSDGSSPGLPQPV